MGRLVGKQQRCEFVLDAQQAWRRGRALDRMLRQAHTPVARGVWRATHAEFNRRDDLRGLEIARRINTRRAG